MDRYKVPRIAFINKCDRVGANPYRVVGQMREKLHLNAVLVELPIGLEDKLEGVVDLIRMKAIYFDGPNGNVLREEEIPSSMLEEANQKREELIEAASDFDDDMMNMILEGEEPSVEMIDAGDIKPDLTFENLMRIYEGLVD